MKKDNFMKQSMRTLVGVTVGGTAIKAVGDSPMASGFKEATQIGVSAGVLGHSMPKGVFGRYKNYRRK